MESLLPEERTLSQRLEPIITEHEQELERIEMQARERSIVDAGKQGFLAFMVLAPLGSLIAILGLLLAEHVITLPLACAIMSFMTVLAMCACQAKISRMMQ